MEEVKKQKEIIKFREHRGGINESMKSQIIFYSKKMAETGIRNIICHSLRMYGNDVFWQDISCEPYSSNEDERIGWKETFVIKVKNYGVFGFTDKYVDIKIGE